jgi:hypothetical protein
MPAEESWPSNFAPAEASQEVPSRQLGAWIQALDLFGVSFYGWPLDNLWAVVEDGDGHLRPLPFGEKGRLPESVQLQLNASVTTRHPRALEAEHLFLFALEALENLADTPGFNDPVSLRGTLYGPFPTLSYREGQPRRCRGRISVSRADVLEGLVRGAPFVFHGAGAEDRGEPSSRSHPLLLPTGMAELEATKGAVVLAYPTPTSLRESTDNTMATAALAYDVLSKLQDDLRRAQVCGAFPESILPVHNRRNLEARFRAKGYEIKGGYAYAPRAKAAGWLGRLFEGLVRSRHELPPEAALPDFLHLARHALEYLKGWPTPQAQAVRKQCRVLEASWPAEGLAGLSRVVNDGDVTEKNGEIVMRARGDKGANAVFRLPPEIHGHDLPSSNPLELEVEWFDDEGGGQICYVPAWQEGYKVHASYLLSGSKVWKTASFQIPNARSDGKLWHGDVGIYFHHKGRKPIRIRRAKVRMSRPEHLDAAKQRCHGNLDSLGALEANKPVIQGQASETEVLPFGGWVLDLGQGTAQGDVSLILCSEQGEWHSAASQRIERPDIVRQYGGAYGMAGFSGLLALKGVPPGLYRLFLRIVISGNYAQRELWQRLKLA